MTVRDDILEQPAVAARQLAADAGPFAALVDRLRSDPVDFVVIAARGTSDNAAIYAQYVLGIMHRLPVALAAPSIITRYGVSPRFERALVVGISQSGASPDIVAVIEAGRLQGAPTLAITNDPGSPLALAAEHVIDIDAGPELAVAATKTYTATLLAIARLAALLAAAGGDGRPLTDLAGLPRALALALETESEVGTLARDMVDTDRCFVLGRGFEYATAREWAIKLKELARVFAEPYSAADFLHGPVTLAGRAVPVLATVPSGRIADDVVAALDRLRHDGRGELLVLSDSAEIRAAGTRSIELPGGVPEWLTPIVSIVPAQLFVHHLARAKGLDPDAPLNLSKVTLTR